ncbi:MAG: acetate--CoA ligase family protein, partial [Synergistaceae bacterium]|nr:acetate--CoA ligase family protein [Synergistaceae bacterium]
GRLAASHTGSLAGSDRVYDALFKKFGVIRVDDLEELIHASQLFATLKRIPRSAGFACVSLSGGETGICADVGAMNGIDFPDFSQSTKDALAAMLPSYATPANPLDATATLSYDEAAFADCLRVLMRDDSCSAVLVGYTLLQDVADPAIRYMAKAMETVSREEGSKPMVMIPFAGNTRNAEYSALLERCGVPILPPAVYAFRILRYLSDFIKYDHSGKNLSPAIPARAKSGARHAMSARGAMRAMAPFGVPFPPCGLASTLEDAKKIADEIGWPVALKIESKDILHKSDAGCVALNIGGEGALAEAYGKIMDNAARNFTGAEISGVLVQKMVHPGTEMIIGVTSDPQFGPAILAGLGGVHVEALGDTAVALAPLSRGEARELVLSLKCSKILLGFRGDSPKDIEALTDVVMAVSDMASLMKDTLIELDLNPVFVYDKGACAVDVVIITDSGPEGGNGHPADMGGNHCLEPIF